MTAPKGALRHLSDEALARDIRSARRRRDAVMLDFNDAQIRLNNLVVEQLHRAATREHEPQPEPEPCMVCGGAADSTLHLGVSVRGHRYLPASKDRPTSVDAS